MDAPALPRLPDSSLAPDHPMARALERAARGRYRVSPNPMVGAVVVAGDGAVVGEGHHREVGGPHAEVEALAAAGERARGATLFVTLEPCAHHGRTPPCVDAVIAAGVARVVAAHRDPDPRTGGRGFERLRRAGIEVEVGPGAAAALELNLAFLVSVVLGRPQVTLKWAMSLDGRIATRTGASQWISHPEGRRWALAEREAHDALLVGSGTVLADDPRLDRRLDLAGRPNLRVVLDRRLRTPPAARLLERPGPVVIYTRAPGTADGPDDADGATDAAGTDHGERRRALEEAAAPRPAALEVVALDPCTPETVLADLHRRGVRSVLVEGGGTVAAAFAEAGLFDRVAVDCAPLLVGGADAPGPLGGRGAATLDDAPRLDRLRVEQRGTDILLIGLRASCLPDLSKSVAAS